MKKIYLLLLIIIPIALQAQSKKKREIIDSASYYSSEMGKIWRAHMDSLYHSEAYQELRKKYDEQIKKSNDYSSFVIFMDIVHSDYRHFNELLAQDGFPPLHDIGYRFGFGSSNKVDRLIVDVYFLAIGLNNSTSKGDEKISTNFSSAFELDLGYDLLRSKSISLYPYSGLALRFSNLRYRKPGQLNPDYSSLVDMMSEEKNVNIESFRIGYQLGLGCDLTLFANKNSFARTILFVKGGINKPFWKDAYRVHSELPTYKPEIRHGDYIITFGFKFGWKG